MAGTHPRRHRIAEVIVEVPGRPVGFGSGYLCREDLVLTARHVVHAAMARGAGAEETRVRVRLGPGRGDLLSAHVEWCAASDHLDLALLRLATVSVRAEEPPELGRIVREPARRVPAVAVGFPAFKQTEDDQGWPVRESYHVEADIATQTDVKTGTFELDRAGRPLTVGSKWRGMSGAGVFAYGRLIGVVSESDREDGPLRVAPLSALWPASEEPAFLTAEPLWSTKRFWSLLAPDDVAPALPPVQRRPAYLTRVAEIAARAGRLAGRESELADLEAFARSDQSYLWYLGRPWAGKTALAAQFALERPHDVDVVSFFISRSAGAQTQEFIRQVCEQLSALVDEPAPAWSGPADLGDLWRRAGERAEATGRDLLLIVDGLDENDDPVPIAALLPEHVGRRAHVLVLSRTHPPIPRQVASGHPLRDTSRCPRVVLNPYLDADRLKSHALTDLEGLLCDREARLVLGVIAAVGPVGVDEIEAVLLRQGTPLDLPVVNRVTRSAPARVLEAAEGRFTFAHDVLREAAGDELGSRILGAYRSTVADWAHELGSAGWPSETPGYFFGIYPTVLASHGEARRLAPLLGPARSRAWQHRTGHSADAAEELSRTLIALADGEQPDIVTGCLLGLERLRLAGEIVHRPPALARGWALLGEWERALFLARSHFSSLQTLAALVPVAASQGDKIRAEEVLAEITGPGSRISALADAGGATGDPTYFERASGEIEALGNEADKTMAMAALGLGLARAGHRGTAHRWFVAAARRATTAHDESGRPGGRRETYDGRSTADALAAVGLAAARAGELRTAEEMADALGDDRRSATIRDEAAAGVLIAGGERPESCEPSASDSEESHPLRRARSFVAAARGDLASAFRDVADVPYLVAELACEAVRLGHAEQARAWLAELDRDRTPRGYHPAWEGHLAAVATTVYRHGAHDEAHRILLSIPTDHLRIDALLDLAVDAAEQQHREQARRLMRSALEALAAIHDRPIRFLGTKQLMRLAQRGEVELSRQLLHFVENSSSKAAELAQLAVIATAAGRTQSAGQLLEDARRMPTGGHNESVALLSAVVAAQSGDRALAHALIAEAARRTRRGHWSAESAVKAAAGAGLVDIALLIADALDGFSRDNALHFVVELLARDGKYAQAREVAERTREYGRSRCLKAIVEGMARRRDFEAAYAALADVSAYRRGSLVLELAAAAARSGSLGLFDPEDLERSLEDVLSQLSWLMSAWGEPAPLRRTRHLRTALIEAGEHALARQILSVLADSADRLAREPLKRYESVAKRKKSLAAVRLQHVDGLLELAAAEARAGDQALAQASLARARAEGSGSLPHLVSALAACGDTEAVRTLMERVEAGQAPGHSLWPIAASFGCWRLLGDGESIRFALRMFARGTGVLPLCVLLVPLEPKLIPALTDRLTDPSATR
ncbi:trypsin-like peptidase domain-containing protein [Streptomyces sp. NPDC051956]|uniref:trypsin-like peptidase domain-containing protein n=1 Tax=Streptomyces sp. NPDC051956 TaxID=3365677 RepID=UPI0037D5640A